MSATAGLGGRRISLTVALALFISLFAVSAASAARPDFDGDHFTSNDCAPLDPAVHPGALDKPDLNFEDTNCDGIDGDKAKAIFVSPTAANNNGTGSVTSPKATLNGTTPGSLGAIAAAKAAHKDVYLAGGTSTAGTSRSRASATARSRRSRVHRPCSPAATPTSCCSSSRSTASLTAPATPTAFAPSTVARAPAPTRVPRDSCSRT
jgi:hypothetical protein